MKTHARLLTTAVVVGLVWAVLPATAGASMPASSGTFAAAGCFTDPGDDVVDLDSGDPADDPRADIAEWCADLRPDALLVSLRAADMTDPATDQAWGEQRAAAAFTFTAADGTGLILDLGVSRRDGTFSYRVLTDSRVPEVLCDGPAALVDGRWTAEMPIEACTSTAGGLPDPLRIRAELYHDLGPGGADDQGAADVAPDGGTISLPLTGGPTDRVDRFAGTERVGTAIAISVATFADGSAGSVVLARADAFADAVVAAPLAVAEDAPLLLTGQDAVADEVLLEIDRVLGGPGEVILLGGAEAIRGAVEQQLVAEGHTVDRVSGTNRFATSVAVARATTGTPNVIFLADGSGFADALVAGAAAPSFAGVVALTDRGSVPVEVEAYLAEHPDAQVYAVGAGARQAAPDAPAAAGATPYATSAALASVLEAPTEVVIASGEQFPDGLAGGAYAARRGAPLLLTPTDAMDSSVLDFVADSGPFQAVTVLGGPVAVSDTVAAQAAAHMG